MILETERLILREMTYDDFDSLKRVWGDAENMKYYPYPHAFDDETVKRWIEYNRLRYDIFGFGLWAAILKDSGEVIGDCGLTMQLIGKDIKPEIGYHIRRDLHHCGYAHEAASAVRDWAFDNTPFGIVYSYMKSENIASQMTAKSYGAVKTDEFDDGANGSTAVWSLTRSEWKKIK